MLYFAYGSNLNFNQMQKRCPDAKFLKKGFINGHIFVHDGFSIKWQGAVGNIVPSEKKRVWGGIFEISENCLSKLDICEGYPSVYDRREFELWDEDGGRCKAIAYLREGRTIAKPGKDYEGVILQGAKDCGLPEDYVNKYLKAY